MNRPRSSSSSRPAHARTSELFLALAADLGGDQVLAGELIDHLAGRGVAILLLVFSLPLCVPNIPGISTLFGLLLMAPSIQMILGRAAVWLPGFVRTWSFRGDALRATLRACGKLLQKVEFLARPRLGHLTEGTFISLAGVQTLVMALVLLLPMPGANVIPGFAVALTGLAILQKDGLFMLLSTAVAVAALIWVYLGGKYVIDFSIWAVEACRDLIGHIRL